jgi:hypothetical protein
MLMVAIGVKNKIWCYELWVRFSGVRERNGRDRGDSIGRADDHFPFKCGFCIMNNENEF